MKIAGIRLLAIASFGAVLAVTVRAQGHHKTQDSETTPLSSFLAFSGRSNNTGSAGSHESTMPAKQQAKHDGRLSQGRSTLSCSEQKSMAALVCAPGLNRTNDGVYSGKKWGRNNLAMQAVRDVDSIPQGSWRVSGVQQRLQGASHSDVFQFEADAGTNPYDRNFIHARGDTKIHPASEGCVITPAATGRMLSKMYMQGGKVRLNVVR